MAAPGSRRGAVSVDNLLQRMPDGFVVIDREGLLGRQTIRFLIWCKRALRVP